MRAIQYKQYGGPEVMQLMNVEPRTLREGEILVDVMAASVNPIDWRVRNGELKLFSGRRFPLGMGTDYAGVVVGVGPGVQRFKAGDEVFGAMDMKSASTFAEQIVTGASTAVLKPSGLSFVHAATLPLVGATAWVGLVEGAELAAGQTVFVHGCLGGVGRAVTQLAQMLGAKVSGSCRAAGIPEALTLGINPVYTFEELDKLSIDQNFDVIFDTVGSLPLRRGRALIRPRGRVLEINPSISKLLGIFISARHRMLSVKQTVEVLTHVGDAADAGHLRPVVGMTVALSEAIPAIRELESTGRPKGKLVILPQ